MNRLPGNLRILSVAGILTAVIVSYVVYDVGLTSAPRPSGGKQPWGRPTIPEQNTRPQIFPQSSSSGGFAHVPELGLEAKAQEPERLPKPSAADRKVMVETVQRIRELLGKAEFDQARLLDERTHTNKSKSLMIEVPAVPPESVQEAFAQISRGAKALPSDSPLAQKLWTEARQVITSFTERPKPAKVVLVQLQDESADKIYIVEFFVDDLKTVARDSDGRLSFRQGWGPGDAIVRDGYVKKGDGWAYDRYAHFFEDVR